MKVHPLVFVFSLVVTCTMTVLTGIAGIILWEYFLTTWKIPCFLWDAWIYVSACEIALLLITAWAWDNQEVSL